MKTILVNKNELPTKLMTLLKIGLPFCVRNTRKIENRIDKNQAGHSIASTSKTYPKLRQISVKHIDIIASGSSHDDSTVGNPSALEWYPVHFEREKSHAMVTSLQFAARVLRTITGDRYEVILRYVLWLITSCS